MIEDRLVLPNLLDDLLRAWDTPTAPSPTAPSDEPEAAESAALEEHGPHTSVPPAPQTKLPSEPFAALNSPVAPPAADPLPASSGVVMDNLLSSLLASYGHQPEDRPEPPQTRSFGAALPIRAASALPARKFVAVSLGLHKLAVPIESVLEAGRYPKVTFVPGLAHYVSGVFSFRGQILPVIDIGALGSAAGAGMDRGPVRESARILTVQSSNGKQKAGLVFDSLEGIVSLDLESLDARAARNYPIHAALSGVCRGDGAAPFGMIDVERLLQSAGCLDAGSN
jgi:chemotaxis signal transduction protein